MPTPRQIGVAAATGSSGRDMVGNPGADPEYRQGGAPAGPWFGADLPVTSVAGGSPATLNGYSPQADQDTLPTPGSTEGDGLPPTGVRR